MYESSERSGKPGDCGHAHSFEPSMRGSIQFCQGGPLFFFFFGYQSLPQRAVKTSLEKQLDPMGPIASRGVSVP